jgi:DNA-binding XRE family transcriptional regulator
MKIEKARKQTPWSSLPTNSTDSPPSEEVRFVWQVLAPRLLHPSKLAFIQALLGHGRPLTLNELAKAAEIGEEHARYQCKSMQRAGVLEIVSTSPRADGKGDEPSYFFPKPPQAAPASSPGTAVTFWPGRKKTEEDIASLEGLGRAVREIREEKGWNQRQLAVRAGLEVSIICAVERAAMELTWADVCRLAEGLEVELVALLELAEALAPREGGERWRRLAWAADRERNDG